MHHSFRLKLYARNLNKPVILTGSATYWNVAYRRQENLITAIEIAAAKNSDGMPIVPEVCIFFENHLMRGNPHHQD